MLFVRSSQVACAIALISSQAAWAAPQAAPDGPSITVSSGIVVGTTTSYPGATATNSKFLGIPFAKSPPLRFGLPEPAEPWASPLQAKDYKPACMQQNGPSTPNGESEDCLYLNVFVPPNTTPASKKTVLFWVYGGNLQSGDASQSITDGSSFAANQDVLVVTSGYRVNVFGFSSAPGIPADQQNVGFFDQRFALDWVKNNIASFGGDPEKITIFGESAGGYSVKYLVAFPPNPLPYRGAILESEATIILGNGSQSFEMLASQLGCPTDNAGLDCVRGKDAHAIQAVMNNQSLGFPPVEDGITFANDPTSRFAEGQSAFVPVIIGTNGQEASPISYELGLEGLPLIELAEALGSFLPSLSGILVGLLESILIGNPVYELATYVLTSLLLQCPTASLTTTLQSNDYSVWRYYYNTSFSNTDVFPDSGAYHSVELYEVWGTYPEPGATATEKGLSAYMQKAWADFAKEPKNGPGWPEYGPNFSVADLGGNGIPGERTIFALDIDQLCPALSALGGLSSILDTGGTGADSALSMQVVSTLAKVAPPV